MVPVETCHLLRPPANGMVQESEENPRQLRGMGNLKGSRLSRQRHPHYLRPLLPACRRRMRPPGRCAPQALRRLRLLLLPVQKRKQQALPKCGAAKWEEEECPPEAALEEMIGKTLPIHCLLLLLLPLLLLLLLQRRRRRRRQNHLLSARVGKTRGAGAPHHLRRRRR
jgi:hypothetical protein